MLLSLLLFSVSSIVSKFVQEVDHGVTPETFDTFEQYYFEENEFFDEKDGIIILKIGAESPDLEPSGVNDWFHDVAKIFHAKVITLQHRYFGKSQPYDNTETKVLKYLTVEQAVEDYGYFHDHYNETLKSYPWMVVGGSYPGLLSAFVMKRFPDKFFASISSAGVVFANDNLTDFDRQVSISMGQECAAVARETRIRIDKLIDTEEDYIRHIFNLSSNFTKDDFYFLFADIFTLGLQYGDLSHICGYLVDSNRKGSDSIMALAQYTREIFVPKFGSLETYSTGYLRDTRSTNESSSRCWFWMTCNQLAYWQTYPGRTSIRSPKLTPEHFDRQCAAVFDMNFTNIRNTDEFNKKYDITNNITHTMFLTNSQDPWTWSCVTEEVKLAESNNYVHTIIGDEMGHHFEFNKPQDNDSYDMKQTRIRILQYMDLWLNEFRNKDKKI